MRNDEVGNILQETADLIELTGGNRYRAQAFNRAARSLKALSASVSDRLRDNTLTEVDGIGKGMAEHVSDIVSTGTFPERDELLNAVPPGLLDVLRVKGLGTKRTRRLWKELDITSLDELEQAAETNRIIALDGFGRKTQEKIKTNLRQLRSYASKWRLSDAWTEASRLLEDLRSLNPVDRAERTGRLRRYREVVQHIDLIVATSNPDAVRTWIDNLVDNDIERDGSVLTGTLPEGLPLRLHLTSVDDFGTAWWRTTGSGDHRRAYVDQFGPPDPHSDERDVFKAAGCAFVPPALREGTQAVNRAKDDQIPTLITVDDIQGCLHNHSTYSDGAGTLYEMAEAAHTMGFSYFGICDHSQSLRIADGLSPDEVQEQHKEIRRLNNDLAAKDIDFRVFAGIESDILRDGSLDYEDEVLETFDFVVASVHTGFNMDEEEATKRVVQAVRNPYTRILGHPTGRLLLSREGYPLDHERVIEACAEHGVAIELNANPYRLDLDWRWIQSATDQGVLVSINPDAHSTSELEYVKWGVAVGRKGWLTPEDCLNAKTRPDFARWLKDGALTS